MTWQIPKKTTSVLGSLCLAAVLLLVVFWGIGNGQKSAQAFIISQTGQQAAKALDYFYRDQNRYPTALEFSDQNTMLNYLSSFPLPEFPSASCTQTFSYKRDSDTNYSLSFCLPAVSGPYQAGWNTVSAPPAQS